MTLETFVPLRNLVLLEIVEESTRSGFAIPDQYKERNFGIIRAIGSGKETKKGVTVPISLHLGDKVIISDSGGRREIVLEGKSYWLIDSDNLLGIMEDEEVMN
jgi:co-chaperonin GroES (HSP10)